MKLTLGPISEEQRDKLYSMAESVGAMGQRGPSISRLNQMIADGLLEVRMKQTAHVTLSQQDLADFLNDNADYMESYRAELERRLADHYGAAEVEISRNALEDKIDINGEPDDGSVLAIMAQMANDLDEILGLDE